MTYQAEQDSNHHAEIEALKKRIKELESESAELKQTRKLLLEEHSFREGVIEKAAEGICVCHATPIFPFVEFTIWNPRMTEITGYSMEQINRLGWYQTMYPDPLIQEMARQRMAKMRDGDNLQFEHWEITRADGEKRTIGISTSTLTTHDGRTHILAMMLDITKEEMYRKKIEGRVTNLEGLLPICSSCKKIRDDVGSWQQLEVYIRDHSEADFTHSYCPECLQSLYPDFKK